MSSPPAPLFRDPIQDGAADPTLILIGRSLPCLSPTASLFSPARGSMRGSLKRLPERAYWRRASNKHTSSLRPPPAKSSAPP